MICRKCKSEIPDDSVICPVCRKIAVIKPEIIKESNIRRNIALVMTIGIVVLFFALSSIPIVDKLRSDDKIPDDKIMDNSLVIPQETPKSMPEETVLPTISANDSETVNVETIENLNTEIEQIDVVTEPPVQEAVEPSVQEVVTEPPVQIEAEVKTKSKEEKKSTPMPEKTAEPIQTPAAPVEPTIQGIKLPQIDESKAKKLDNYDLPSLER